MLRYCFAGAHYAKNNYLINITKAREFDNWLGMQTY